MAQEAQKRIETMFPEVDRAGKKRAADGIHDYFRAAETRGAAVPQDETFQAELARAVMFSEFVAAGIAAFPEFLGTLFTAGDLERSYTEKTFWEKGKSLLSHELRLEELKAGARDMHLKEMIRIAWRDLNAKADLNDTMQDLSALAQFFIETAADRIYHDLAAAHGPPLDRHGILQPLMILAMGKLGAGELNFSSDIDLVFVYGEKGGTDGKKPIANETFFTRLCRQFLHFFDARGSRFNFYRVDTRLRPLGATGPLVMAASDFEAYYQSQGREWERYAFIKARPVGGDKKAGQDLLAVLNPFVFRRYFDYGTFESFRDMKNRIYRQIKSKNLERNIKLGPGGIREIEFFGQIFQLIRGGVEPELQEQKILNVLDILVKNACIGERTRDELADAYVFLRKVENRLQAYADLQTHDIPDSRESRIILALSMGFDTPETFMNTLDFHRENVHRHFNDLLVSGENQSDADESGGYSKLWGSINDPQSTDYADGTAAFEDTGSLVKLLKAFEAHPNTKKLTASGRNRLDRLVPMLLQEAAGCKEPELVLGRLLDLITTIETRVCYISLLLENRQALQTLSSLAQKSPWIISFLSEHPALLDELLDPHALYRPPEKADLVKNLEKRMHKIPPDDVEFQLEELCIFKQVSTLRVAAADISGDYPLMKVSDHLTYIAETVLDKVLEIAWRQVTGKYGRPSGVAGDDMASCRFIAVAYGKIGGYETGYKSDIDLIFAYSGEKGTTQSRERPIANIRFYSYLGQRIVSALTMHTPAGKLYTTDLRLRPGGEAGMIVTHINAFSEYMEKDAWTWEHQALIRARPLSGDEPLKETFNTIRTNVLRKKRDPVPLREEISRMREKLREKQQVGRKGFFDLKQGRGGIVDIEFLVQFLVLKTGSNGRLTLWTDNVRLLETLAAAGVITENEESTLREAYLAMRRAVHRLNLQEKPLVLTDTHFLKIRENVVSIYEKNLYKET